MQGTVGTGEGAVRVYCVCHPGGFFRVRLTLKAVNSGSAGCLPGMGAARPLAMLLVGRDVVAFGAVPGHVSKRWIQEKPEDLA